MKRVQIPAYTDRWMMGDQYGVVVKTSVRKIKTERGFIENREVAHVKLDKSGKTMRFILADCKEVR
jgi:hypothetical protein